jgi:hypothetical protein
MPARKLQVTIRRYTAETLRVGGVELGVLRLGEERRVEVTASDPIDALVKVAEEESRASKSDYVEILVDDRETRRIWGSSPRHTWSRPLSYKPEPLLRVGIVRKGHLKPLLEAAGEGGGEAGPSQLDLDAVEWHKPPGEVYVFEGKAQLESDDSDVELVVIETPSGRRLVRPSPASLRRTRSS